VEKRNTHRVLVGKPEETKELERHTCRWEDSTGKDLKADGRA
jgi:hypothetical protein